MTFSLLRQALGRVPRLVKWSVHDERGHLSPRALPNRTFLRGTINGTPIATGIILGWRADIVYCVAVTSGESIADAVLQAYSRLGHVAVFELGEPDQDFVTDSHFDPDQPLGALPPGSEFVDSLEAELGASLDQPRLFEGFFVTKSFAVTTAWPAPGDRAFPLPPLQSSPRRRLSHFWWGQDGNWAAINNKQVKLFGYDADDDRSNNMLALEVETWDGRLLTVRGGEQIELVGPMEVNYRAWAKPGPEFTEDAPLGPAPRPA